MEILKGFPACFSDNMNWLLSFVYMPQIHLRIDLDGRVDEARLLTALGLAVRMEPVLRCRFVEHWLRPYWEQMPEVDYSSAEVFRICQVKSEYFQGALNNFLSEPICENRGPQFKVMVLRTASADSLILKLNHQAADACAVKGFGYLLASLYTILKKHPRFDPQVHCKSRSLRQVFAPLSIKRQLRILGQYAVETLGNYYPSKNLYFPVKGQFQGFFRFVFKRFHPMEVRALKAYCIQTQATVNDVMTAALLRALAEIGALPEGGVLRMAGTVDLRRYLIDPNSATLCNLSSFYFLNLGKNPEDNFYKTLSRVKSQMDSLKSKNIGLSFILGNWLFLAPFPFVFQKFWIRRVMARLMHVGHVPPVMTNMGLIDERRLDFGSPGVAAAELIAPPCYPPFFGVGLSGFRDSLSLSAGGCNASDFADDAQTLFDRLSQELLLEIHKMR